MSRKQYRRLGYLATSMVGALLLSACGVEQPSGDGRGGKGARGDDGDFIGAKPPREYYDALFKSAAAKLMLDAGGTSTSVAAATTTGSATGTNTATSTTATPTSTATTTATTTTAPATGTATTTSTGTSATSATGPSAAVLWVNFDGATVSKGVQAGQSFLVCADKGTVPVADELSAADRTFVVQTVQKYFDASGAKLSVTMQKPAAGDYTTIHVGGTFADLGCADSLVLGAAPLDLGNANPNDIGFVFSKHAADAKTVAQAVAHAAGHTYGLKNVSDPTDLMFNMASDQVTGFKVSPFCDGSGPQDEPALLKKALNIAPTPDTSGKPSATPGNDSKADDDALSKLVSALKGLDPKVLKDLADLLPKLASALPSPDSLGRVPCLAKFFDAFHGRGRQGGEHVTVNVDVTVVEVSTRVTSGNGCHTCDQTAQASNPSAGQDTATSTATATSTTAGVSPEEQLPPLPVAGSGSGSTSPIQAQTPPASNSNAQQAANATPAPSTLPSSLGLPHRCGNMGDLLANMKNSAHTATHGRHGTEAQAMVSVIVAAHAQQMPDTLANQK